MGRNGRRATMAVAALAGMLGISASGASADTYRVTRHNDPNPGKCKPNDCSVREAIRKANNHEGRDVVVLPDRKHRYNLSRSNATSTDEEQGRTGDLDVTGPVTIRHGRRGTATIDANGIDRVLDVHPGASTKLVRIKVTGGDHVLQDPPPKRATVQRLGPLSAGAGGGISSEAPLELVRSAVTGNRGALYGGGIHAAAVRLVLLRSRVSANRSISVGAGINAFSGPVRLLRAKVTENRAGNAGGGVVVSNPDAKLRMSKSTVAGNVAEGGFAGVYLYEADARITQSTISGNDARNSSGGGLEDTAGKVIVVNSTITRNRADGDGGGVDACCDAEVDLNSVTVARNAADADGDGLGMGGGLFVDVGTVTYNVVNSILALNHGMNGLTSDCYNTFSSGGGNVIGSAQGCLVSGGGGSDVFGMNPKLGQLRNNGGPTKTLKLKKGSPAIGNAVKSKAPKRDQRGHKRDKHPDSGAFER